MLFLTWAQIFSLLISLKHWYTRKLIKAGVFKEEDLQKLETPQQRVSRLKKEKHKKIRLAKIKYLARKKQEEESHKRRPTDTATETSLF